MIRLTRQRPPHPDFTSAHRIALEQKLLDRIAAGKKPLPSVWKKSKDQLKAEANDKCAYCEAHVTVVAHGDVEHYRPKSVYWWLSYTLENFAFSCQVCNQIFKSNDFPVHGSVLTEPARVAGQLGPDPAAKSEVDAFRRASRAEKPGVPNPYETDPERLFIWRADAEIGEVEIKRRPRSHGGATAFAAVTEFLGLNRDELRRERFQAYDELMILVETFQANSLPPDLTARVRAKIAEKMSSRSPYAGMARYFVKQASVAINPAP